MKCPDCGQELKPVSVSGFDKSLRCENCGGFWMEGWVVNRVAEGKMNEFPEVKADIEKFGERASVCPVDKSPLFGYTGDDLPPDVTAFKCSHCGWWWFPDGNLLKFKKAYDAKNNYVKFWRKRTEAAMMALPIIMVLLLVVGLGASVFNVSNRQSSKVEATANTSEFKANYKGNGVMEITFKSDQQLQWVFFKTLESDSWGPVEVQRTAGTNIYYVRLSGLKEKQVYQMQIQEKRYYFQTN